MNYMGSLSVPRVWKVTVVLGLMDLYEVAFYEFEELAFQRALLIGRFRELLARLLQKGKFDLPENLLASLEQILEFVEKPVSVFPACVSFELLEYKVFQLLPLFQQVENPSKVLLSLALKLEFALQSFDEQVLIQLFKRSLGLFGDLLHPRSIAATPLVLEKSLLPAEHPAEFIEKAG